MTSFAAIAKSVKPLESEVQAEILSLLRQHPRVAWVGRFNSGSAPLVGKNGVTRPVFFNSVKGCPDILGQLKDGRIIAIEVKRPGWMKPTNQREQDQANFLDCVTRNGGVGGFAVSVDDVLCILGGNYANRM